MTTKSLDGIKIEDVGRRLAITRQVLGLPQNDFCKRAKIAANTYNQYEKGKKMPSVANATKLADAYNLTLDWIFRGDPSALPYDLADAIRSAKAARTTAS